MNEGEIVDFSLLYSCLIIILRCLPPMLIMYQNVAYKFIGVLNKIWI